MLIVCASFSKQRADSWLPGDSNRPEAILDSLKAEKQRTTPSGVLALLVFGSCPILLPHIVLSPILPHFCGIPSVLLFPFPFLPLLPYLPLPCGMVPLGCLAFSRGRDGQGGKVIW